ncbi:MAG TPA: hypothetical protein VKR59_06380 [Terriglobales bacterium]|nr:hypothetical protein [Terriglobales bacterium]
MLRRRRDAMEKASEKIPPETAKELRVIAHDLSNSLETIIQACYLLAQEDRPEKSRRWIEMIDQASRDAVKINLKLREVLRRE